jgi:tetratricopeptide (TPR) repeat protein
MEGALSLFRTASKLASEPRYHYNYAAALCKNGFWQEAKNIFDELLLADQNNPMLLYGMGICCHALNDKKSALAYAEKVAAINDYSIGNLEEYQIADLFFLCDEYAKQNKMYDDSNWDYYPKASWLGPYFYCLSIQRKTDELVQKFNETIDEKNRAINDWDNESYIDYDEKEKQELIQNFEREKADIESVYHKIVTEGFKPDVKLDINFIGGCWLLDCPRCQRIN